MLHVQDLFSRLEKNMAAPPSEFISQMVTYLHAGSHVKPRRGQAEKNIKRKNLVTRELFALALDKIWLEK